MQMRTFPATMGDEELAQALSGTLHDAHPRLETLTLELIDHRLFVLEYEPQQFGRYLSLRVCSENEHPPLGARISLHDPHRHRMIHVWLGLDIYAINRRMERFLGHSFSGCLDHRDDNFGCLDNRED